MLKFQIMLKFELYLSLKRPVCGQPYWAIITHRAVDPDTLIYHLYERIHHFTC